MAELKGIRMMARPWQPQDLLDDLQLLIDEEPDRYLNDRRTTLCMARDFLKEHFREDAKIVEQSLGNEKQATSDWISVEDRLPENNQDVLCWYEYFRFGNYNRMYRTYGIGYCINGYWGGEVSNGHRCKVLAWMPLPDPPKEEV